MSEEKGQSDGAPKKKLRFLTREEKERLGRIMLGEERPPTGITPNKGDKTAESPSGKKAAGGLQFETPQWVYDMAKRYGEPTMTREELSKALSKELGGKSLSDFVIEERRKRPY